MGGKGCVCMCVFEKKMKEKKIGSNEKNNRQRKKKKGERSFPECFLRMIILPTFIRSKGAHREPGFERLAWFRNIVG